MHRFSVLLFFCLYTFCLFSQEAPAPIFVGPDAPDWMLMMQSETPNVRDITDAYTAFYQAHTFEKNSYTNYYKRWMHWARSFTQPDGSLHLPSQEEMAAHEALVKTLRAPTAAKGPENALGSWTFVGPKQTYDIDGTTEVTWQTNLYSIDVAPSDPNVVYAGGETGGLWRTTDKGLNWTLLTKEVVHNSITAVKVHPTDPNTAYFGTNGKIMKTINGGASWTQVYAESGLDVNEFAFKTDNPEIMIAASDKGLLRTVNGGGAWSKLFTNLCWTVKSKPGDPLTFFAVRDNGTSSDCMLSSDGGATFSTSNTGWWTPGAGEEVTGAIIAVCPSTPDKLYAYLCGAGSNLSGYIGVLVSSNSGASWTNTNPAGSIGNSPTPYSIPDHTNLMASNGTTGLEQGFYDMAIIVNPSNSSQLIAGGTSWYKSTDSGATWSGLGGYQSGLSWSHPDMQCMAANGSDLWIATDGGINYSTNFGGTIVARMNGVSGADLWGFDSGWNEDVLVGGRYHNGNMAWHELFPSGKFYRMGGAEAATGYVNPGDARKTYFSDIGGKRLKGGFSAGVSNFSVGLFPNESYAYYANSEMVWDPRCWNIVYTGNEHKIWKSTDGGASFSVLYTFPGTASNKVYDIEIARSNPDIMYCSQWDGTDDKMWRSTNGGTTWTALTALPLPNNNDRVKMAVAAENADVLWVAVTYGSNNKKIYKSADGGVSWTNLTTSLLNGVTISAIMAQYGTDGGIYLGTDAGVFYRNNSMGDWTPFSDGLPYSLEANKMKPFYKTGKIRNGSWGFGVWESNLFEPSQVIAQAMCSALHSDCSRDTVYFDDYSVVNHTGATWSWTFSPAPAYVSATNVRNPKVVFGASGNYSATMTLNGTFMSTLDIVVDNKCVADTIPGKRVKFGGNTVPGYVSVPPLNINTNTITISAWVKIDTIQPDYSCIFMHDGESAGFNFRGGDNHLGYHWSSVGSWGWNSGLIVPVNVWTHVAMVVEPSGVTLYVNGKGSKHTFTAPMINFSDIARFGNYKGWSDRYMRGKMDEVCIFNNSLSQAQIRELMHLTKDPAEFSNLIAYYQFNETSGQALDKVGIRHASLVGSAAREISTAPVGKGHSTRLSVTANGVYFFPNTGLTLDFPAAGPYPAGELCVSRIDQAPDQVPGLNHGTGYWIVNNYGNNTNFNMLDAFEVTNFGYIEAGAVASDYSLYKRGSFAEGNTWGTEIDNGDAVFPGVNGDVYFNLNNNITSFSQLIITYNGPLPVEWLDFRATRSGDHEAELWWKVNQTADAARFVVERSVNGIDFKAIASVTAFDGAGEKAYPFIDQNPLDGNNFYRIRQEDADGKMNISPIRQVFFGKADDEWLVYPNPVPSGTLLTIATTSATSYRFILYNAAGKKVRDLQLTGTAQIALQQLPAGHYAYAVYGAEKRLGGMLEVK
jgi:photosystem II stability/assembly factor-like uncharacterized protein